MITTTKSEIIRVSAYLKEQAEKLGAGQYSLSADLLNVAFALQGAADGVPDDEKHPHVALKAELLPNALDEATSQLCNTDCPSYRLGCCKYIGEAKLNCPRIRDFLADDEE